MARRPNMDELIHCDACGEDYSATYKRCPFCGEKYDNRTVTRPADDDDDDDGYVFDGQDLFDDPEDTQVVSTKGGKRLSGTATATRRTTTSRKASSQINWPRLITFLCSLIIIVAALVIIFTVIYPQLHKDPPPNPPSQPVVESTAPVESDPVVEPSGEVSAPPASVPPTLDPTLNGFTMKGKNDLDFTLRVGESHTLVPVFDPEGWSGEVTFTSSDTNYATVTEGGVVTNVNATASLRRVTITVTAGGHVVECTVYCRGTGATESTPPVVVTPTPDPNASPEPTPSSGLAIGAKGKIIGAPSGLRVRSGPGTTYEILASLVNGNEVTILADAGNGWYQISYAGANGAQTTGFIMGQYISVP